MFSYALVVPEHITSLYFKQLTFLWKKLCMFWYICKEIHFIKILNGLQPFKIELKWFTTILQQTEVFIPIEKDRVIQGNCIVK